MQMIMDLKCYQTKAYFAKYLKDHLSKSWMRRTSQLCWQIGIRNTNPGKQNEDESSIWKLNLVTGIVQANLCTVRQSEIHNRQIKDAKDRYNNNKTARDPDEVKWRKVEADHGKKLFTKIIIKKGKRFFLCDKRRGTLFNLFQKALSGT